MNGAGLAFVPLEVCRRIVDVRQVVELVQDVYQWQAEGKVVYSSPVALRMKHDEPSFKSHSKAVILPELGIAGVRVVGYRVHPDGSGPSSPDSTRLVILIDLHTGSPIGIVDEHDNYTLRTAASVGVAARFLHPSNPTLGLVGAGGVAFAVARVFSEVMPLQTIVVTSRRESSRRELVDTLGPELGVPIEAVGTIDEVLESSNIVTTATTTKEPLIRANQVRPGTLYCALGSFELEPSIYRDASKVLVDDWSQTASAHDMKPIIEAGTFGRDDLYAELSDVVSGAKPGRESDDETIVVRTEGMASQDVAIAYWTFEEAKRRDLLVPLVQ